MISLRLASSIVVVALFAQGASATLLQSANFSIPTQNYNAAGSTGAQSANYQTFVDVGEPIIGISSEPAVTALAGHAYTLFFASGSASSSVPLVPAAPGTPSGAALGVSSISWTWAAAANASSYQVFRASGPRTLLGAPATTAFADVGLATNTAYGIVVDGLNASAVAGPLSAAATAYTLAAPPSGTAASQVQSTSATLTWSLNGNPAATLATVQRSTDDAAFASVYTASAAIFTDYSLLGCTTYYYRVRNANGSGIPTAFDVSLQLLTLSPIPSPATTFAAQSVGGGRIALSWTPSPTEGIVAYDLFYDAGAGSVNYGTPLATLSGSATSYLTAVLTSSAAYTFALRARHRCGVEETAGLFATAGAAATLASVRAAIVTPQDGRHIAGAGLSVVARLTSGSPAQVRRIIFQSRASGVGAAWTAMAAADVNHPNPAVSFPFLIHWNANSVGAGAYDLRALAVNVDGSSDTAPDAITVVVDPAAPDVNESAGSLVQSFYTSVTNNLLCGGGGANDPVVAITIPPGAVSNSTVSATVVTAPTLSANPPAGFSIVGGLSLRVTLSNGQSVFLGGDTALISFSYAGALPADAQIWALNENTGVWSKDFNTTVDPVNRVISGDSPHFTVFAVLTGDSPGSDLGGVRAYPTPYRPNSGNPDLGGGGTGIFFDRLPASAAIKIYTVSGQLVASFDASSPTGKVNWNARGDGGRDVATGAYFAVITSPGVKTATRTLLIIR